MKLKKITETIIIVDDKSPLFCNNVDKHNIKSFCPFFEEKWSGQKCLQYNEKLSNETRSFDCQRDYQ